MQGVEDIYCVIQEVQLKSSPKGCNYKELETYKTEWSSGEETLCKYGYRYTGECFERPIKKAYKISLHESYREDGKVKKRQWSVCTMSYYDLIEFCLDDCAYGKIKRLSKELNISRDEIYNLIYIKLDPLVEKVEKEYHQTEEYKTQKKHQEIINKYLSEKYKFEEKYGSDSYDYYYDVFGVLREPEKFEAFKKSYQYKKEHERSYYEEYKSTYGNFFNSSYSVSNKSNYTEEEKGYLKKIYRAAAVKLHPDIMKDDGAGMKFLNELKEKWGI